MDLKFSRLELTNFGPFAGGPHVLDIAALGPGLHYVRGFNIAKPRLDPNGVGKSTLWAALTWCLYGKTVRGLRNPDITPWTGKKGVLVRVILQIDGVEHVIRRSAHPNSLGIDERTVGQEQVEELIGLSFDAFSHTVLYGQGRPLFFDLPPREMMDVFSDVMCLDRWEARSELAADRARKLETDLASAENALAILQSGVSVAKGTIARLQKASTEWEVERNDRCGKLAEQRDALKTQIEKLDCRHGELDTKYDWVMTQIRLLEEPYQKAQEKVTKQRILLKSLENEKLKTERSLEVVEDNCPTCGRPMDNKHKRASNKAKRELIASLIEEIRPLRKRVDKADKQAAIVAEDVRGFRLQAADIEPDLKQCQEALIDARARLRSVEEGIDKDDNEPNPHRAELLAQKKHLKELLASIEDAETLVIPKLRRMISRAKFWVKGFKDVRLSIIDEVLTELEITTATVLEELGLVGWQVKYATDRETKKGTVKPGLHVSIVSPDSRKAVRWECWSGGEGQRLRIVGALALSEVLLNHAGIRTNLEIFDEVTTYMPKQGIGDLCDLLSARCAALGRTGFYIDHQIGERASFAGTITVQKKKAGATLH